MSTKSTTEIFYEQKDSLLHVWEQEPSSKREAFKKVMFRNTMKLAQQAMLEERNVSEK